MEEDLERSVLPWMVRRFIKMDARFTLSATAPDMKAMITNLPILPYYDESKRRWQIKRQERMDHRH